MLNDKELIICLPKYDYTNTKAINKTLNKDSIAILSLSDKLLEISKFSHQHVDYSGLESAHIS